MSPPPEQFVVQAGPRFAPRAAGNRRAPTILLTTGLALGELVALALLAAVVGGLWGALPLGSALFLGTLGVSAPFARPTRDRIGVFPAFHRLARRIAGSLLVAAGGTALLDAPLGRTTLLVALAAGPLLLAAGAAVKAISGPAPSLRTLVVGTDATARAIVAELAHDSSFGLTVRGAVGGAHDAGDLGTQILGSADDLAGVARRHDIEAVIVTFDESLGRVTAESLRPLIEAGVEVWVVPRFHEVGMEPSIGHIGGIPVVRLRGSATHRPSWRLKRVLDVVVASLGLAVTAPLQAIIAAAVWVDSGKPILFRQCRLGLDGKPFDILKFRTMAPCTEHEEQTEWSPALDRVTRIGGFLRATALDELPQLWNVLKGELTLVGPRPERPVFVSIFEETYSGYGDRHRVPVGITGWAQIHGLRGTTSIEDRTRFDNHYIENWSLLTDLKILLLTPRTFLRRNQRLSQDNSDLRSDGVKDRAEVR